MAKPCEACRQFYGARSTPSCSKNYRSSVKTIFKLIVGDIPPLGFEIASSAGIPSVALSNFSWDDIYRAYRADYPGFDAIVEQMTAAYYQKATLTLTLPYPCDMTVFPCRQEIPWVARTSASNEGTGKNQVWTCRTTPRLFCSASAASVLNRLSWDRFKRLGDFYFVATGDRETINGNLCVLSDTQSQYEDLVQAVDAIVTKPGYGIVADVLAHKLPMLYTDRGEFPEYPRLVEALGECATAEYISQAELLSGNLAPSLHSLFSKPPTWPLVRLDGAAVAAEKILQLFDQQR